MIEKDWIELGYPFSSRSSIYRINLSIQDDQYSPVFTLFLDCVFQIHRQYPQQFEFNTNLLLFLNYHCMSCKYSDFVFYNDKQKKEVNLLGNSIWTKVFESIHSFKNSEYKPFHKTNNLIYPHFSLNKLKLWEECYYRHSEIYTRYDPTITIKEHNQESNKCLYDLKSKIEQLNAGLREIVNDLSCRNIQDTSFAKLTHKSLVTIKSHLFNGK